VLKGAAYLEQEFQSYTCEWICLSTECQVSLGERVSFIQRTRAGTWELQTAEIV
jgi:hypothetical protein